MSTFLLVRHAAHDWLGRGIPGRLPGVELNAQGRAQARELAERLNLAIDAIFSSPQQRAQQTAVPLAARLGRSVAVAPEFDEIDFGAWTGWTMEQVQADAALWRHWVERRGTATPPGGEPFVQVAGRAAAGLARLARLHPRQTVLVVSHGDVIKAALASCLGLSLDRLERFDIAPASISIVTAAGDWRQVKAMNLPPTGLALPL